MFHMHLVSDTTKFMFNLLLSIWIYFLIIKWKKKTPPTTRERESSLQNTSVIPELLGPRQQCKGMKGIFLTILMLHQTIQTRLTTFLLPHSSPSTPLPPAIPSATKITVFVTKIFHQKFRIMKNV